MRDKQIEEMEKIIQPIIDNCWAKDWFPNGDEIAEALYNAGYRKASDVAREIFEEIEKLIVLRMIPDMALIDDRLITDIVELKKKYESEVK